jgi:hypothetical protein
MKLVDLVKLDRMDSLIRRCGTGSPEEFAKRLNMSRSNLFELISFLKEVMKAPIVFNRNRQSYVYSYMPTFHFGFEGDRLNADRMNDTYGGNVEDVRINKSKKRVIEIEIDDDFILDNDIDFVNLYQE